MIYFVRRFGWLPSDVRRQSWRDLQLVNDWIDS